MGTATPSLASTEWTWALRPGAQVDELGPVADELTELSLRRWGDPGLGQTPHAEQIDQVRRVALVVLHPPVAPVVAERVGQVHVAPALFDHVGRPVPPVGGFEDHLGVLAGLGQFGGQGHRRRCRCGPCRASRRPRCAARSRCAAGAGRCRRTVFAVPRESPSVVPGWFGNPKCAPHTWSRTTGGLPLGLRLGSVGLGRVPRCHEIAPRARRPSRCVHRTRHAGAALRSFITSDRPQPRRSAATVGV